MLENGHPPDDWNSLLLEARAEFIAAYNEGVARESLLLDAWRNF